MPRDERWWVAFATAFHAAVLVIIVGVSSTTSGGGGAFWTFGPSGGLELLSVPLETWPGYLAALLLFGLLEIGHVLIEELVQPLLRRERRALAKGVATQTGLDARQLRRLRSALFVMGYVRGVLFMLAIMNQADIAIWGMVCAAVTHDRITPAELCPRAPQSEQELLSHGPFPSSPSSDANL